MGALLSIKCGGNNPNDFELRQRATGKGTLLPLNDHSLSTILCHGPSYKSIFDSLSRYKDILLNAGNEDIVGYSGRYLKSRGGKTIPHDPHSWTGKTSGKIGILASGGLALAVMPFVATNHYFVAITHTPRKNFVLHQKHCERFFDATGKATLGGIASSMDKVMGQNTISKKEVYDVVTGVIGEL